MCTLIASTIITIEKGKADVYDIKGSPCGHEYEHVKTLKLNECEVK